MANEYGTIANRMRQAKMCVLMPTYNNAKTLARIIDGVLALTSDVIVINDGATDDTFRILESYKSLEVIHLHKNKGKGAALQAGFGRALELGYEYAITIDSDGQHYPEDIAVFLDGYTQHPKPLLLIGSRNMQHESVPGGSSFGNNFSNFWYRFETGIRLSDTQSGFRLYPLQALPKRFFTNRFEFEIEVIVRAAWNGITVKNVPIQVLYDPAERVSHFRPYKDFARISLLNTALVIIALAYIKPRDLYRSFKKKNFRRFIKEDILESNDSNKVKALSMALGVFIGIAPLWGLQTVLSIFLAVLLRLNKVLSFAFSNVSIPPMIPFIIFGSLWVGGWFIDSEPIIFGQTDLSVENIKNHLLQYLIGSVILAIFAAVSVGIAGYLLLQFFTQRKINDG
ncbi:MAG: DUF2062 domain-containing protein [Capnocytophaga sp.]|nr:DUF2062 domain-containing protein [Capnocytophaga sp.]